MNYLNYLKYFDFDVLLSTTFLLPFFGIIVLLKIVSVILFAIGSTDDDEKGVTIFSNILFYLIFSFSVITIYDHHDRKGVQNFRFSLLGNVDRILPHDTTFKNEITPISEESEVDQVGNNIVVEETLYIPNESELLMLEKDPQFMRTVTEIYNMFNQNTDFISKEVCGQEEGTCKWCGIVFQQQKFLKPTHIAMAEEIGLNILFSQDGWNNPVTYRYVKEYEKGIKKQCVTDKKEFCSLKCEKEFKLDRGY